MKENIKIEKLRARLEKLKEKQKQKLQLKLTNISTENKTDDEMQKFYDDLDKLAKKHGFTINSRTLTSLG